MVEKEIMLPRAEWHFRQLIKAMRAGNPLRSSKPNERIHGIDVNAYVKVIKDITNQSFGNKDMFLHPGFDHQRHAPVVRFKVEGIRNQLTQKQFAKSGMKVPYREMLDCITIPLMYPKSMTFWKARLVIAVPLCGAPQIAIQALMTLPVQQWVTFPCTTGTVQEVINDIVLRK